MVCCRRDDPGYVPSSTIKAGGQAQLAGMATSCWRCAERFDRTTTKSAPPLNPTMGGERRGRFAAGSGQEAIVVTIGIAPVAVFNHHEGPACGTAAGATVTIHAPARWFTFDSHVVDACSVPPCPASCFVAM